MPTRKLFLFVLTSVTAAQVIPRETLGGMETPKDLQVTGWASRPGFSNPTDIDIDSPRRVWAQKGVNYRNVLGCEKNVPPPGRIVEDTNGDGRDSQPPLRQIVSKEVVLTAWRGVDRDQGLCAFNDAGGLSGPNGRTATSGPARVPGNPKGNTSGRNSLITKEAYFCPSAGRHRRIPCNMLITRALRLRGYGVNHV